jgi:hypothetical protein
MVSLQVLQPALKISTLWFISFFSLFVPLNGAAPARTQAEQKGTVAAPRGQEFQIEAAMRSAKPA